MGFTTTHTCWVTHLLRLCPPGILGKILHLVALQKEYRQGPSLAFECFPSVEASWQTQSRRLAPAEFSEAKDRCQRWLEKEIRESQTLIQRDRGMIVGPLAFAGCLPPKENSGHLIGPYWSEVGSFELTLPPLTTAPRKRPNEESSSC
jgi:hypothetical protein